MMRCKLIALFFLVIFCSYAQEKKEFEERITRAEFPKNALIYIDDLPQNIKRLKFFKETDGDRTSFEAKFKLQKRYFSIEFNNAGELEDIEVLLKSREVPIEVSQRIRNYFKQNYKRSRLIKIQKQYPSHISGKPITIIQVLNNEPSSKVKYEIIAETKKDGQRELVEYTFSNEGVFLSKRIVIPSSYNHVLY